MKVNFRIFKIVAISLCCFCAGIGLTVLSVFAINKTDKTGMGGFETANPPIVKESTLETTELSEEDLLSQAEAISFNVAPLTYQTYRVKSGDMIGFIADKYNVTQDTIISVNNIKQSRLIQVGQYLKIPSMPGILYTVRTTGETPETIAKKYDVDADKIAKVNSLIKEVSLSAGASLFVPDAELDWVTRQEINGDLFHRPIKNRYWLSSPYGWRSSPFTGKRSFHGGMDMAANMGTPIYASLDGRVTTVAYNETYGNYVIITHHSGYKSLYAHMSKVTCKKGNFVYTNTKIGEVGSTGLSTGPHLHFTIYKNGKTVNPSSLIN